MTFLQNTAEWCVSNSTCGVIITNIEITQWTEVRNSNPELYSYLAKSKAAFLAFWSLAELLLVQFPSTMAWTSSASRVSYLSRASAKTSNSCRWVWNWNQAIKKRVWIPTFLVADTSEFLVKQHTKSWPNQMPTQYHYDLLTIVWRRVKRECHITVPLTLRGPVNMNHWVVCWLLYR